MISQEDIRDMKASIQGTGAPMELLKSKFEEVLSFYERIFLKVMERCPDGVKIAKLEPKQIGPWTCWAANDKEPASASGPAIFLVVLHEDHNVIDVEMPPKKPKQIEGRS